MGDWHGTSLEVGLEATFFDWETEIFEELQDALSHVTINLDIKVLWVWKLDPLGGFSVKSAYVTFCNLANTIISDPSVEGGFLQALALFCSI